MARIVIEERCPPGCTSAGCTMDHYRRRVLDPGSFVLIERASDGSWPDWVLVGLGWTLDDSHDLAAVMDGIWRERPR